MLSRILSALLLTALLTPTKSFAREVTIVLSTENETIVAGEPFDVSVYLYNTSALPVTVTLPSTAELVLRQGEIRINGIMTVKQDEIQGQMLLPSKEFLRTVYTTVIPVDLTGEVELSLQHYAANPIIITALEPRIIPADAPTVAAAPPLTITTLDKKTITFQDKLSTYKPIYFAYGFGDTSKFQISFKYQLFNEEGWLARNLNVLDDIYFAYTQRSIWDISAESAPFEDSSYMPELFWLKEGYHLDNDAFFSRLDLQAGFQHESNGKAGDDSRSLNIAYIRPSFYFGDLTGYNLEVKPTLFAYVGSLQDNPDIYRYRGYGDLTLKFGKWDGLQISAFLRQGTDWGKYSYEFDVTYPSLALYNEINAYWLVQYFNGYGESLLNYNERSSSFRLGIAIVR